MKTICRLEMSSYPQQSTIKKRYCQRLKFLARQSLKLLKSSGTPDKLRGKLIYTQTEDIMGLVTFALIRQLTFSINGTALRRRFPLLLLLQEL